MTRLTQKNRISEINNKILLMADLVEKQILKSMSNLKRHDPNFVEEIIKDDTVGLYCDCCTYSNNYYISLKGKIKNLILKIEK